ncbi:MAG: TraB/GumN family protein [Hyphomicrobiaceae bacterium]|nr:TraB/GumN family protein [Hyphomicrobiaceae bacterium]
MSLKTRAIAHAALLALSGLLIPVAPAFAQDTTKCVGRDLLGEFRAAEPKLYLGIEAEGNAIENGKALLWKIEHEKFPNRIPSYLFGTMHVSDERLTTLPAAVETALGKSRRIALEVEAMTGGRLQEVFNSMQPTMTLPEGGKLDKLLNEAEMARLAAVVKLAGLPPDSLNRLRPWVLTMLMSTSECQIKRMRGGKNTLDGELAAIAERRGMGTFGLESLDMQFQALASVPDADQVNILKATLKSYDKLDDSLETMTQLYLKKDIGIIWPLQMALAEKNGVSRTSFDAFKESMIVTRNVRMRDRAMMHVAYGGVFIAVGALHLPGKKGLVELFRETGHKVTAVE